MKVIFIKDLKGQGKKGEIKEVKEGYGHNFLIKNGYAVAATEGSINRLDRENEESKQKEDALIRECEALKKELLKLKLIFKVKTGKDGRVFGSVTSKQISGELEKYNFNIDKKKIMVKHQLDSLGTHDVTIELHKKVIFNIEIKIEKE